MDNPRNLMLAAVLSIALLFGWEFVVDRMYPVAEVATDAPRRTVVAVERLTDEAPAKIKRTREGGLQDAQDLALEQKDLAADLTAPGRVKIDAPEVVGSINPVGARIDDVELKSHRETVAKNSGPVRLFSPAGTPAQQFAQFGWVGQGVKVPDANTVWQASGGPLAPGKPVTLTWDNGQGQLFTIRFTIDDQYMITAEQTMANTSAAPVLAQPYAFINRTSRTASQDTWTVHSGPIGAFAGAVDFSNNYDDVAKAGEVTPAGAPNWVGFTDIYWLSALVPQDKAAAKADFRAVDSEHYRADLIYDPVTVPAGKALSRTTRLFAGAKESEVLDSYEDAGVAKFGLAIDWGWFRWFEVPIFWLLKHLYQLVGNFGLAIILLTFVIRGLMFPVAQKQFASMAQMRAVQPKMKALQERYKDDKQQLSQEMAKLYKEEKVNPLTGCLPIFIQIPVFFALYKTLQLSVEMRHKPFLLWIDDLSAPDPSHIVNLFGLLHFTPPTILGLGVLGLVYGLTMWATIRINPSAMDPTQQQIMSLMPWVMMFAISSWPAGFLLYWIASNMLTLTQQSYLSSKYSKFERRRESPDRTAPP
uniref:membrane protein insertase YidC n=1 Tax=Altererythrobacter segetis TaxID=1104773 RepID=UPI00140CFA66|nr:membrane protein insertase YidC [Altererythrobacter segetis]